MLYINTMGEIKIDFYDDKFVIKFIFYLKNWPVMLIWYPVTQSELNIKLKNIIVFGSVVLAATSKNRGMYIKVGIGIFDYGVL